jgi:hypothetical protein
LFQPFLRRASSDPAFRKVQHTGPIQCPCREFYSLGKDIFRAKRTSLSDQSFNMLMFMKGNSLKDSFDLVKEAELVASAEAAESSTK